MPHEDVSLSARISILPGLPPPAESRVQAANASGERRIDRSERNDCTRFSVVFA
jgi:hypothetical protein